jgi:predicted small lipoprotein YifL
MKKMINNFTQFAVLLIVLAGCGSMLLLSDDDNNISTKISVRNSSQIESVSPAQREIAPTEKIKIKKSLSI